MLKQFKSKLKRVTLNFKSFTLKWLLYTSEENASYSAWWVGCGEKFKMANFMYGYIFVMYWVVYNMGNFQFLKSKSTDAFGPWIFKTYGKKMSSNGPTV